MTAGGAPLAPTYEPDEFPTGRAAAGIAGQLSLLMVVPLAILPALVAQLAGETDAVAARAVVASMVVCGATTLLLTVRLGRLRSDSMYVATVDLVSLPFCILALASGGPATMAALVVVSGLFQIVIGLRLSYLRRVVTPQVRGTVLILAFAALVPVLADAGSALEARLDWFVPISVLLTVAIIAAIVLWAPRSWRIWAPAAGVGAGLVGAVAVGAYDFDLVADADWVGLAEIGSSPGWDIDYETFVSMLPSFLIVSFAILVRSQGVVWDAVSQNGLTAGSLVLVVTTVANSLIGRRGSLVVELSAQSTAELTEFVRTHATRRGCDPGSVARLEAAAEEALAVVSERSPSVPSEPRWAQTTLGITGTRAVLEFVCAPSGAQNLEERIALLAEPEAETMETEIGRDAAVRLLRHYSNEVSHRQYLEAEILTAVVTVRSSGGRPRTRQRQGRTS